MALNTSYAEQAALLAGQIADATPGKVVDSAIQAESSAAMPFGRMVARSAGPTTGGKPQKVLNIASSGDVLAGVHVHSHEFDRRTQLDATTGGVLPGNLTSVMSRGRIGVVVEEAVAVTDTVYYRHTASGGNTPGSFRNDADSASCAQLYGARFVYPTSGAGVTVLEFDLTAHRAH